VAQHFLLSSKAKTLRLADVLRMTDQEAETTFGKIRWFETEGEPVCPHCGGLDAYKNPRPKGAMRYRCKACTKDFTITSGTLFASHKRPLRDYLAAIAIFCNEVKGKSALALSRDLGLAYKSAFVLVHKLREAMAEEIKGRTVGGAGKVAEVDGGYFGGYVKPANHIENRVDRRLAQNRTGKRKSVIIIRERNGNSVPAVFPSEGAAVNWIKSRIQPGTIVNADEAAGWDKLNTRLKCAASITKRRTALMAHARIWRRNFSAASAARRSVITITSPEPTCSATRRKRHGARTTAALPMANKSAPSRIWR
jgi:transposase-like protein